MSKRAPKRRHVTKSVHGGFIKPKDLITRVINPALGTIATNEVRRLIVGDKSPYSTFNRIVVPAATGIIGHASKEIQKELAKHIPDDLRWWEGDSSKKQGLGIKRRRRR